MSQYQIPVIELGNDVPKEAVCQVFENVNQKWFWCDVFGELYGGAAEKKFQEINAVKETIYKARGL